MCCATEGAGRINTRSGDNQELRRSESQEDGHRGNLRNAVEPTQGSMRIHRLLLLNTRAGSFASDFQYGRRRHRGLKEPIPARRGLSLALKLYRRNVTCVSRFYRCPGEAQYQQTPAGSTDAKRRAKSVESVVTSWFAVLEVPHEPPVTIEPIAPVRKMLQSQQPTAPAATDSSAACFSRHQRLGGRP